MHLKEEIVLTKHSVNEHQMVVIFAALHCGAPHNHIVLLRRKTPDIIIVIIVFFLRPRLCAL